MDFKDFLLWEKSTRDTIDFKKIYVDIAGDLNAGLMLSEIVFWYLPSRGGSENKLKITRNDELWIACRRYEWWDRTRMSPKEVDRATAILIERGIVSKQVFKFDGEPTVHLRLIEPVFMALWEQYLTTPLENPFYPKVKNDIDEKGKTILTKSESPVTETTTETTAQTTEKIKDFAASGSADGDLPDNPEDLDTVKPLPSEIPVTAASASPIKEPVEPSEESIETPVVAAESTIIPVPPAPVLVPAKPLTPQQRMFEAICQVFRYDTGKLTRSEKGMVGKAASELVKAGYQDYHVIAIYWYCRENFDQFTPAALPKHATKGIRVYEAQFGKLDDGIMEAHLPRSRVVDQHPAKPVIEEEPVPVADGITTFNFKAQLDALIAQTSEALRG